MLSQCQALSALSDGAFDVTVQPLWTLYAAHFFGDSVPSPDGPPPQAVELARTLREMNIADARSISKGE